MVAVVWGLLLEVVVVGVVGSDVGVVGCGGKSNSS